MMSEGWKQKELRDDGWEANHEVGRYQKWRHNKCPFIRAKAWNTTTEAIKLNRQWKKLLNDLFGDHKPNPECPHCGKGIHEPIVESE